MTTMPHQSKLTVQDCWDIDHWHTNKLHDLVRVGKTKEILQSIVKCKQGLNVFVWKAPTNGTFYQALAWEVTQKKADLVWHHLLPKKFSIYMWKALLHYLPLDDQVRKLGIPTFPDATTV